MTQEQINVLRDKYHNQKYVPNGDGTTSRVHFFDGDDDCRKETTDGVGLRGLGLCGHPITKWPITHILEETDQYIVACCDAGCAVIIEKNPPIKKEEKVELSVSTDGQIEETRDIIIK